MNKAISRRTVLIFGVIMIAISVVNIILLQYLAQIAKITPPLIDNRIFASELSVALYILPVVFAGIGVNVISHILIQHLTDAEKQYDITHKRKLHNKNSKSNGKSRRFLPESLSNF